MLLLTIFKNFRLWGLFLFISLSACSERQRLNPLDPENPNTLGKPTGLNVISRRDTVELRWDRLDLRDLTGFRIYRQIEGQAQFTPIGVAPAGDNSFRDLRVNFGVLHTYRITAFTQNFESPQSDIVTTTPGPTFSWVADASSGDLIKLTHDGQHEIQRAGVFGRPLRLKIDAKRNQVWVIDRFGGEFSRLDKNGKRIRTDKRISGPAGLAVDESDGSVWLVDSLEFGLMKFDSAGALIKSNATYKKLAALAVHPATSELWALDRATLRVLIFTRNGELRRTLEVVLQRPFDLDIDTRTGKVWIADDNRVQRLSPQGVAETLPPQQLRLVYRVAADEATGGCWLIDYTDLIRGSDVIKLQSTGGIVFTSKGFDIPERLAVNPFDGSCLVADSGNGRVVRISANGQNLSSYDRVFSPFDVDTAQ